MHNLCKKISRLFFHSVRFALFSLFGDRNHCSYYKKNLIIAKNRCFRWGFITHGGIDGYSRMVTFLKCSCNNEALTVLDSFVAAVNKYGVPTKVRSDRGTLNLWKSGIIPIAIILSLAQAWAFLIQHLRAEVAKKVCILPSRDLVG